VDEILNCDYLNDNYCAVPFYDAATVSFFLFNFTKNTTFAVALLIENDNFERIPLNCDGLLA